MLHQGAIQNYAGNFMYLSLHGLDFALLPDGCRGVLRVKYRASSLDTSTLMIPMRLLYDKTHVRNNRFRSADTNRA